MDRKSKRNPHCGICRNWQRPKSKTHYLMAQQYRPDRFKGAGMGYCRELLKLPIIPPVRIDRHNGAEVSEQYCCKFFEEREEKDGEKS